MRIYLGCVLALCACGDLGANGDDGGGGGGAGGGGGGGGGGSSTPTEGDCPGGGTCSPRTPSGLEFRGALPVGDSYPDGWDSPLNHHILAGATDDIVLRDARDPDEAPFALAFTATTDGPALAIEAIDGATIHLRETEGQARLRIVDPSTGLLFDRYAYAASPFATATAIPTGAGLLAVVNAAMRTSGIALWHGHATIGVALQSAGGNRLIDTGLVLAAPAALAHATQTAWDTLDVPAAAAGTYTITAQPSAGASFTVPVAIVDHVDTVSALQTTDQLACFAAFTGGKYVANVPWTFEVGGSPVVQDDFSALLGEGCLLMASTTQPFVVTAHAGGVAVTITTTPGTLALH